jgi:hypothetical protein
MLLCDESYEFTNLLNIATDSFHLIQEVPAQLTRIAFSV